jgi:hypothetical protein
VQFPLCSGVAGAVPISYAALLEVRGYVHDGARFELSEAASCEIGTRFGKVAFERPVGRRVGWRRPRSGHFPDSVRG